MAQTHRFFLQKEKINPKRTVIDDRDMIKKMRNVLRLEVGDEVVLFDGEGSEYSAEIQLLTKEEVVLKIGSEEKKEVFGKTELILGQALTRSNKIDEIVRMNTEVGVSEFGFFETDYGIVKLKDFNEKKLMRWEKIAQEAARQSERTVVPKLDSPISFDEILKTEASLKIILHSRNVSGAVNLLEVKKKIRKGERILILIGPEGGFSKKEIDVAKENGFTTTYLDLPILRTETAGVVASAILLV